MKSIVIIVLLSIGCVSACTWGPMYPCVSQVTVDLPISILSNLEGHMSGNILHIMSFLTITTSALQMDCSCPDYGRSEQTQCNALSECVNIFKQSEITNLLLPYKNSNVTEIEFATIVDNTIDSEFDTGKCEDFKVSEDCDDPGSWGAAGYAFSAIGGLIVVVVLGVRALFWYAKRNPRHLAAT